MKHYRDVIPVGTVCRFLTVEEMRMRRGGDLGDEYTVDAGFNGRMEHLCGQQLTISKVLTYRRPFPVYRTEENIEKDEALGFWTITGDMLEIIRMPGDTEEQENVELPSDDDITQSGLSARFANGRT